MGHIYYCEHCDYDAKGHPGNYYRHLKTLKHQKAVKRTEKLTETYSISDDSIDESLDKIDIEKKELDIEHEKNLSKNSCFLPILDLLFKCKTIQVTT